MTPIIKNTYEVYFKIALYPEGVNGFHFEEEHDEETGIMYGEFVEDFEDFKKYLCSKHQSTTVLEFLRNEYYILGVADVTVCDIEFENNGKFKCKVKIITEKYDEITDDDLEEIIENAIWPGFDAESIQIFIDGKALKMDLKLDYFVEGDDEDEDDCIVTNISSDSEDKYKNFKIHQETIFNDLMYSDEETEEELEEDEEEYN
jgi:hypothetical protein